MSAEPTGGLKVGLSDWLGATTLSNTISAPATLEELQKAIEMLPDPPSDLIAERMRKEGFDPERDWCVVPANLREVAGPWPPKYLRFSAYVDGVLFMRNPAPNANSSAKPAD